MWQIESNRAYNVVRIRMLVNGCSLNCLLKRGRTSVQIHVLLLPMSCFIKQNLRTWDSNVSLGVQQVIGKNHTVQRMPTAAKHVNKYSTTLFSPNLQTVPSLCGLIEH